MCDRWAACLQQTSSFGHGAINVPAAGAPTCSTVMAAAADTKRASDCLRVADVRGVRFESLVRGGGSRGWEQLLVVITIGCRGARR